MQGVSRRAVSLWRESTCRGGGVGGPQVRVGGGATGHLRAGPGRGGAPQPRDAGAEGSWRGSPITPQGSRGGGGGGAPWPRCSGLRSCSRGGAGLRPRSGAPADGGATNHPGHLRGCTAALEDADRERAEEAAAPLPVRFQRQSAVGCPRGRLERGRGRTPTPCPLAPPRHLPRLQRRPPCPVGGASPAWRGCRRLSIARPLPPRAAACEQRSPNALPVALPSGEDLP